jgi:septal ring factor EnvC (AmiA/AmiB activator)
MENKTQHTLEPWVANEDKIEAAQLYTSVAKCYSSPSVCQSHESAKANAARIVACVNACAGMIDPVAHIERLKGLYDDLHAVQDHSREVANERDELRARNENQRHMIEGLKEQNEALLAALQGVKQYFDRKVACGPPLDSEDQQRYKAMNAAINNATKQ